MRQHGGRLRQTMFKFYKCLDLVVPKPGDEPGVQANGGQKH